MLMLLNAVSPWLLALGVVAVAEAYSIGLMLLCRRRFGTDRLALNNEVAGFKFAVVGVFYAVLLAFVVVAVWEDYRDTEVAVRNEAKAIADLHQVSFALPAQIGEPLRKSLNSYVQQVRELEWPAMAEGVPSSDVEAELQHLGQILFQASANPEKDAAIYHHALDLLTTLSDNRDDRLDSSNGTVPNALWLVLLAGAVITLGYPSFFGTSNLVAQILMTGSLAALVALSAFVGIVLDYPFTGDVRISDAPFQEALRQMPAHLPPQP
jgi:Protein of unknown function (DUF4239)